MYLVCHKQQVMKTFLVYSLGVTPTHAWFCVSDVDIYDTSIYPFVFISQYVASKSFIIMTHETLHKLAAEISFEKDTRNLILVDNTARCGSTLMCQMFYKLPNTRVMSEPWALQHTSMVRDNYRGHPWLYNPKEDITQMSERDFTKLITSVTKVLFKYENKKEYDRVVLKVSVTLGQLVPYIKKTMPRIKCIMMSRHVKISIESFEKMLRGWGPALTNVKHIVKANDLILNWCPFPYADDKLMDMKKRYVDMNKKDAMAILKVRLIMYGSSLLNFLHHKSLYMHTVVFEDLMKSTKEELELMYQKLDIPTELVANAMEALKTHSQRGVFTSNVLVKSKNKNIFSDSDWEICDSLFKEMGLPITKDMSIDQLRDLMQLK